MKKITLVTLAALSLAALEAQAASSKNESQPVKKSESHHAQKSEALYDKKGAPIENSTYVKIEAGLAIFEKFHEDQYQDKRPNNTNFYGLGIGYTMRLKNPTRSFRGEVVFSPFSSFFYDAAEKVNDVENRYKQKIKVETLMANFYYDIANYKNFTPFITAGVGTSRVKSGPYDNYKDGIQQGYKKGETNFSLAWNIGTGATVQIDDNIHLELAYKFNWLGKVEANEDYYSAIVAQEGELGGGAHVRYTPQTQAVDIRDATGTISQRLMSHTLSAGLRIHF